MTISPRKRWTEVSHPRRLSFAVAVAAMPTTPVEVIAQAMNMSRSTGWSIAKDFPRAGLVEALPELASAWVRWLPATRSWELVEALRGSVRLAFISMIGLLDEDDMPAGEGLAALDDLDVDGIAAAFRRDRDEALTMLGEALTDVQGEFDALSRLIAVRRRTAA